MKIIILLFVIIPCFAFSQSGRIIYEVKSINNDEEEYKIEDVNVKRSVVNTIKKLKRNLDKVTLELKFNTNESIYESLKKMNSDYTEISHDLLTGYVYSSGKFYTNLNESVSLQANYTAFNNQYYTKVSEIKPEVWEIQNKSKSILGYECFYAETEVPFDNGKYTKVKAWFAKEIPFSFGPREFFGLPGMILGLEHGAFYYEAKSIDLSSKTIKIKNPTKGKVFTTQEYLEYVKSLNPKY